MIALGNDHGAFGLKKVVIDYLDAHNMQYTDCGTKTAVGDIDYPDYTKIVAQKVADKQCEYGILLCGTGIGMSIAANRFDGVRAAVCTDTFSAKATRAHNNANILCMGERVIGFGVALEILDAFFNTPFEEGRHARRIAKIEKSAEK